MGKRFLDVRAGWNYTQGCKRRAGLISIESERTSGLLSRVGKGGLAETNAVFLRWGNQTKPFFDISGL